MSICKWAKHETSHASQTNRNFFFQEKTEENELKTKKLKTKIASAKKLLNKNVKLNTKIVFDEEGEVRLKLRKKYSVCQSTI